MKNILNNSAFVTHMNKKLSHQRILQALDADLSRAEAVCAFFYPQCF